MWHLRNERVKALQNSVLTAKTGVNQAVFTGMGDERRRLDGLFARAWR
jgi:hypothetical protein